MELKEIIETLNNSPRFGRPEQAKTVVITDALAKAIVKELSGPRISYKKKHEQRVYGACPQ